MSTKTLFGILILTTVFAANGPAQSCAPPPPGLIDWWPGDGNAQDIAGTNNGKIPDTNVTFGVGEVNQAFSFSGLPSGVGTGNEVDFGTNVGNFGTNDFTVDFWIKQPTYATSLYSVLSKRPECSAILSTWDIRVGPVNYAAASESGNLDMEMSGNNNVGLTHFAGTNKINDGRFHHAAFVRAGITLTLYVDGEFDSSTTNGAGQMANITNTAMFKAGQEPCVGIDGTEPFMGELDELDLFNRALSPSEIYAIYQAGNEGKCKGPSITTQPQSVLVQAHDPASFSVTATGPVFLYQWSLNGTNLPGATSSTLTISNVKQTNLGSYAVFLTNAFGSTTSSNATLAMYPFLATPFGGLDTYWGYTNTLSVGAWGTGPLDYQWFDNGTAIGGATNDTLTLTGIQLTNAGLYSVVVSNAFGSITNTPEQVVVNPAGVYFGGLYPSVLIQGVAGYNYVIQSTTNLSNTNAWVTVTNLTLTKPMELWIDSNTDASLPANPNRFYQVLPGSPPVH